MSVLDGFFATWSNAKATFGEGTPQTGDQFDGSAALGQAQSTLDSAAPGSWWTGGASTAYGAANAEHQRVIGEIGALDKSLAAQVNKSAEVATNGRTQLDAVRQWVVDAAASVPPGKNRDQLLLPIANKGVGQVMDIVQKTNGELGTIGSAIQGLSGKYDKLAGETFTPKEGKGDIQAVKGEKKEEDARKRAEQDVKDALAGNQEAAAHVDEVIGSIKPGQELSAEQGSYLSQMQAQQKGMTVEQLTTAEQRLGEHKDIIGDSWQLMSNDDVYFPKTEPTVDALDNPSEVQSGNKNLLPDSVQHALNRDGLDSVGAKFDPLSARTDNAHEVSAIADIVHDGNPNLQKGTQLDDAMLDWSRETMHDPTKPGLFTPFGLGDYDEYASARDNALGDVFNTAGRDHESVSAELSSDTGQQFLTDLHTHVWAETADATENRRSTHTLLDWIGEEAHSSDDAVATRAGAAAHALAENLNANHEPYLNPSPLVGATPNVANLNPELIAADAIALEPYQDALVGDLTGTKGFEVIGNPGDGDLDAARNVFAVIDSDPGAAKAFNAAAEQKILTHQQAFADAAAAGPPSADTSAGDLKRAGFLLGAVNGGAEQEANARGLQGAQTDQAIYDIKKGGLDYLFGNLPGTSHVPGFDLTRDTVETGILGVNPEPGAAQPNVPMNSAQHAINSTYHQVATALDVAPGEPDIPAQFFSDGNLKSPDQVAPSELDAYSTALQRYLFNQGYGDLDDDFDRYYRQGAGK
jgi:EspA-like secreted protein